MDKVIVDQDAHGGHYSEVAGAERSMMCAPDGNSSPNAETAALLESGSGGMAADDKSKACYLLYCSHFLSRWGSRMWEFAVALFMVEILPRSLLLTAVYGLVEAGSVALFGMIVGRWVDSSPRLKFAEFGAHTSPFALPGLELSSLVQTSEGEHAELFKVNLLTAIDIKFLEDLSCNGFVNIEHKAEPFKLLDSETLAPIVIQQLEACQCMAAHKAALSAVLHGNQHAAEKIELIEIDETVVVNIKHCENEADLTKI
ncbi:hypothetical protein CBR_g42062 [Chara braunii]|uniref:Solute carrier family 40 member n=1 Tax=Chara braunii TaxID=69332 RepID=A0A388LX37_CHABU|nr:hypothetical protein CBR_g42062 [Chara braunii]|eukprot:GBG86779.1 hypothetical protein CBR_g42062 [Chara braunii]